MQNTRIASGRNEIIVHNGGRALVDRIKLSLCTFNIITTGEGGVKVNGTNGVFHWGCAKLTVRPIRKQLGRDVA